jgi:hypothetical protein
MSKRKLRQGETRPRYRDRYNARDAATYRPHGTAAQVRRRIEAESVRDLYETPADALALITNNALRYLFATLLGRQASQALALETFRSRMLDAEKAIRDLGEDAARMDSDSETHNLRLNSQADNVNLLTERVNELAVRFANANPPPASYVEAPAPSRKPCLSPAVSSDPVFVPPIGHISLSGTDDDALAIGGKRVRHGR